MVQLLWKPEGTATIALVQLLWKPEVTATIALVQLLWKPEVTIAGVWFYAKACHDMIRLLNFLSTGQRQMTLPYAWRGPIQSMRTSSVLKGEHANILCAALCLLLFFLFFPLPSLVQICR